MDVLTARGVAYALLARLLGADTTALADASLLADLADALEGAGVPDLPAVPVSGEGLPDAGTLRRRWVRWFDQGRVAPYECSNTAPSAGGHTPRLADIAGFYRAFGMRVSGERPDHVVAELEFAALVTLAEAAARERGDGEAAEVSAHAARAFLRDHLGRWLDAFAARVVAEDELAPWAPYATLAAGLVAADAAGRNVIPLRSFAVLPSDASLLPDEEALPECGGDAWA